jgi:hypothetical protein
MTITEVALGIGVNQWQVSCRGKTFLCAYYNGVSAACHERTEQLQSAQQ